MRGGTLTTFASDLSEAERCFVAYAAHELRSEITLQLTLAEATLADPNADTAALREILAKVRKQGYAATDQELEEGLRSLAVPIHDAGGTVVAALNVSAHASRATMAAMRRDYLPLISQTAADIEADLRRAAPSRPARDT